MKLLKPPVAPLLLPAVATGPLTLDCVHHTDALSFLKALPDESVNCIVTSPPYFGLRDYGTAGQIGLEPTPAEFVQALVAVFREARRVLRSDGVAWLNLGDSYAGGGNYRGTDESTLSAKQRSNRASHGIKAIGRSQIPPTYNTDLPGKNLLMIPARVAIALQDDGWIIRSEVIWAKPNPMPESVTDRCTKAHEMVYMLTKAPRYWYDADAIREPAAYDGRKDTMMKGSAKYRESVVPGQSEQTMAARGNERWLLDTNGVQVRNRRDVWTVATEQTSFAHFACVDSETEALTSEGWKHHTDLKDGELIAAYNKDVHCIEWQPATFHRYDYNGEMVVIEKRDTSQRLTPNHRCLIRRRQIDNRLTEDVVEARDLKSHMQIPTNAEFQEYMVPAIGADYAALVGWYITEGEQYSASGLRINQSESANPQKVETIRELLQRVNADFTEKKRDREWRGRPSVEVAFVVRGDVCARIKELAPCKHLTPQLATLPIHEARVLLEALIDGDGHRRKDGRTCIVQKGWESISMMQMLALRCGYRANIGKRSDGNYCLYITEGGWLTLRSTNGKTTPLVTEHYQGVVWCPSVPSTFWLARRNGKPFITGNTFPQKLIEPMILAGCPAAVCARCGAPLVRIVEVSGGSIGKGWTDHKGDLTMGMSQASGPVSKRGNASDKPYTRADLGFAPSCRCENAGTRPGVVLDMFAGSGTSLLVARKHGRHYIGSDLNASYVALAQQRLSVPYTPLLPMDVPAPAPVATQMEMTL